MGFIEEIIKLLEKYQASIIGRIWIKPIGTPFNGRSVYTSSIQNMAVHFQIFLSNKNDSGVFIADSRNKPTNAIVSHSIFTQKYKAAGDVYDRILEMPVYGHSDNHAALQITDLIASAVLFPIATSVYCAGFITNRMHHHPHFLNIKKMFGKRLSDLQYRYRDLLGWHGGIIVSDPLACRNGSLLFK